MKRIYYAHCMAIYYTKQEKDDISTLNKLGFEVLNPSADRYKLWWKINGIAYADRLVKRCSALAFRRLPDGRIPAGVGYEINVAIKLGLPIIELPANKIRPEELMTREETRAYILKQPNVEWYKERIKK